MTIIYFHCFDSDSVDLGAVDLRPVLLAAVVTQAGVDRVEDDSDQPAGQGRSKDVDVNFVHQK